MNCCALVKLQKNTYNTMCELFTLPSNSLEELYAGEKCGNILILNFKHVGHKIYRMKARDLVHWDNFICQEERFMSGLT